MLLADVIAILPCICNLCFLFGWCCSLVALLFLNGWWCCYHQAEVIALLADVIAILVVVGITTLVNSCTRMCAIGFTLFLADGIAKMAERCCHVLIDWQMLLPCGWCYCHCFVLFVLGRCYSLVADVIATIVVMFYWQILLPGGWWNCLCGCGWQME